MKKIFICYSDEKYQKAKDFCCKKAKETCFFNDVRKYSPKDLDPVWAKENESVLSVARGAGLWLWKPYLILKTLKEMADGDFLFYADSGSFFIRSPRYIYDSMGDEDIWVSDIPLIEKQFTKPSLFHRMDCTEKKYSETRQIQATFFGIRKTERSVRFAEEWFRWSSDYTCISPEEKNASLPDYYIEHREDQSILSLLCKKHGIEPHQDPSQFSKYNWYYYMDGRYYELRDHYEYPVSILLHRCAKAPNLAIFIKYIRILLPRWLGAIGLIHIKQYISFLRYLANKT